MPYKKWYKRLNIMPFWNFKWFLSCLKVGFDVRFRDLHTFESMENELKLLAIRYNVDWHEFGE